MALDQFTAESLAQAYERGDYDQVNNILGGGGISAQDVQSYFGFDDSAMSSLGSAGIQFASPQTYSSTDEQGNPIYDYVAPSAPVVQAPVSGLSAVTSGKGTVLEDVSTPSTGALAQATTGSNTVADTTSTGALTTTANNTNTTANTANTGALTQAVTGSTGDSGGGSNQTVTNSYLLANPDVAAAYNNNSFGLTEQQFADAHYINHGQDEKRTSVGITGATSGSTPDSTTVTANPYDAISQAWIAGDVAGTTNMIKDAGLTPAQIKAYFNLDDATMAQLSSQGIFGATGSTTVTGTSTATGTTGTSVSTGTGLSVLTNQLTNVSTGTGTGATTDVLVGSTGTSTSVGTGTYTSIDTALATVGSGDNKKFVLPGYGAVAASTLATWEPWRLDMLGLVKDANGEIQYKGAPAWETATGTAKTLFDEINGISNLSGMQNAYTGGA